MSFVLLESIKTKKGITMERKQIHPLSKECTILLVEDEDASRIAIESFLRPHFKYVYTAQNGAAGLKTALAKEGEIDIVISDIVMPELNGIEMVREFRRNGVDAACLLISAFSDKVHLQKAIEVGVSGFLQKPLEHDSLVAELNKILERLDKSRKIEKLRVFEVLKTLEIPAVAIDINGKVVSYNKQFEGFFHPAVDKIALFKLHQGNLKISTILEFADKKSLFDEHQWHKIVDANSELEFSVGVLLARVRSNKESFLMRIKNVEMQNNTFYLIYFLRKDDAFEVEIDRSVVLIIDESSLFRKLAHKELEGLECDVVECDDVTKWEVSLNGLAPSVVIIDFALSNSNGLKEIEKLSMHPIAKHALIIVTSSVDIQAVAEKIIKAGASKIVRKPFVKNEIKEIVARFISEKISCNRANIRYIIDGLVNFCNSDMSAYRMLHKMYYLNSITSERNKSSVYYDCLANLLSTVLKEHTPKQLMEFLNSIKAPSKLMDALIGAINPTTLHSRICHTIFYAEKSFVLNGRISFDSAQVRDKELEALAMMAYSQFAYIVQSGRDAEYVWRYYFRQLSEVADVNISRISTFNELISKTLIHQLLFGEGGTCRLNICDDKIFFIFEPILIDTKNIDKLLSELHSFEHDIAIYFTSEGEKPQIIIELDRASAKAQIPERVEMPKEEVMEFINFSPLMGSGTTIDEHKKSVSASEYLRDADIDPEDIRNLKALEEDILEFIELFDYSSDRIKVIQEMASLLRSYGTQIIYLREFQEISSALIGLGNDFEQADYSVISDAYMKFFPVIFLNLVHDLKKWREGIFVTQDMENIHYLDASIIANCEQCVSMLKSFDTQAESGDDSGEIEFF